MDEYIERAAAIKSVLRMRRPENSVAQNRMLSIIQMDMLKLPAADVAPVVHGWWEKEPSSDEIRRAPTVDAVVVVRCEDCVHWDDDPDTYGADYGPKGKCMKSFETMCADDFCSYGKRREDA